jgi:23S rRNA (pseudouridine1915-N3)-methyltransferase
VKYRLLCVGRRARDPLVDATEDYGKRLGHYATFELLRLRESNRSQEADDLLARLNPQDWVVVLDERGESIHTMGLCAAVRAWQARCVGRVVFVIGGADGLEDTIKRRANQTWALSALTLPHRAAQMLLVEQLYRAHTILRGEKYHRA